MTAKKKLNPLQAAQAEGLLDAGLLALDPARWPAWARARYGVQDTGDNLAEPLTIEETR